MSQDGIPPREVRVRTVRPDEQPRWNDLMRERHYLGFRNFCGRWIGWASLQRRQRLFLVANQSRFLLLTAAGGAPHLASRVLGLSLRRLPDADRPVRLRPRAEPADPGLIGSRRRPQSGRYEAPGISSWHYILKRIDALQVERMLAAWTAEQVLEEQGDSEQGDSEQGEACVKAVAMDGKVLCGSYDRDLGADGKPLDKAAQQQLSALDIDSGTVIGQRGFSGQKDEAEGAALRELAAELAGSGTCVIADALHTNRATAQHLLDLGLDSLLAVKDLCWGQHNAAFSPETAKTA